MKGLTNPPFFATDKTLLLKYYLVLSYLSIIMYDIKWVVFAYQLPQERRRSILGQRGGSISPHPL